MLSLTVHYQLWRIYTHSIIECTLYFASLYKPVKPYSNQTKPNHNIFSSNCPVLVSHSLYSIAMSQTVVLRVKMSCCGCSGAVKRVLDKMEGVESYDINMDEQKVTVKGNVETETVLQTISKTGKKAELWEDTAAPAESETTVATEVVETEARPTAAAEIETKLTEAAETETKPTEAVETKTKPTEDVAAA